MRLLSLVAIGWLVALTVLASDGGGCRGTGAVYNRELRRHRFVWFVYAPTGPPRRWQEDTFTRLRGRWWHSMSGSESSTRRRWSVAEPAGSRDSGHFDWEARLRLRPLMAAVLLVACNRADESLPASESAATPRSVVHEFYAAAISQRVTGAPTPAQLTSLAPYLSDTLRALLTAARRRTEADAARDPNEKPMFVEGDLFSSLFEGPNVVEVVADSARGAQQVATVRMASNTANPPVVWTDRVILVQERGRYVIDDVEYAGTWDFANKGTLRASLVTGLATPP